MKKLFKNSPIFYSMLGICSALAITTNLENAIIMGISVTITLTLSNGIISILRKIINDNIKIPAYILIISTLVTIIDIFLKNNFPLISSSLGIYIPLIIVNCIILSRAINFASKNKFTKSIIDGLNIGFVYTISIMLIALIREVLGSGTITIIDKLSTIIDTKIIINLPKNILIPNNVFVSPAGAFLTLGIIIALINRGEKHESN